MNLKATTLKADRLKAEPLVWRNLPEPTIDLASYLNRIEDKLSDSVDAVGYRQPKKISYICKNCNGHINPATMKCEYCDTQY